jgi:hypothetical protein
VRLPLKMAKGAVSIAALILFAQTSLTSGFSTEIKAAASATAVKKQTTKRIAIVGAGVSNMLILISNRKSPVGLLIVNHFTSIMLIFQAVGRSVIRRHLL